MSEPVIGGNRIRPIMANADEAPGAVDVECDGEVAYECGDEEVEVGSQEADDVGEEDAGVRVKLAPTQPSNTEREKHDVTHCPYRSWCAICVAGRGQKTGHKKQKRDGSELPRFAMDYGFLGDEGQPTASLLVMREPKSGMMLGMIVEKKGVELLRVSRCALSPGLKLLVSNLSV